MSAVSELRTNEFWKRKFQRATEVLETDKNGLIERSDFLRVIQCYKDLQAGKESVEHIKALTQSLLAMCDHMAGNTA